MNIKTQFVIISMVCFINETAARTLISHHGKLLKKCSKCPPGWGVKERCKQNQDTICQKCIHGKTYSPHGFYKSPCLQCSRCGVGLYESQQCTIKKDTVCNECIAYIGQKNFIKKNDFSEKCAYLFSSNH